MTDLAEELDHEQNADAIETGTGGTPSGPGGRLRAAREGAGLSLDQVAAETRISLRHLELIEANEFSELPGRTYAVGFSRNYARAVGLDGEEVAEQVRGYLGERNYHAEAVPSSFEPGDPARVPSRGLAWFALIAAIILAAGIFAFYQRNYSPGAELASLLPEDEPEAASDGPDSSGGGAPAAAAPDPSGAVVFTALEDNTWVKFYDASGAQLMQKEMALGESYTVPADADGPQIWTGRPFALRITIGGREVPKLSEVDEVVRDVPVTAEALLARDASPSEPATE